MGRGELVVLKCRSCGDVFTCHTDDGASCPSCGGIDLDPAQEPLL